MEEIGLSITYINIYKYKYTHTHTSITYEFAPWHLRESNSAFLYFLKNQVKPMQLYDTFRYCQFSCSQPTILLREIQPPGYPLSLGKL